MLSKKLAAALVVGVSLFGTSHALAQDTAWSTIYVIRASPNYVDVYMETEDQSCGGPGASHSKRFRIPNDKDPAISVALAALLSNRDVQFRYDCVDGLAVTTQVSIR